MVGLLHTQFKQNNAILLIIAYRHVKSNITLLTTSIKATSELGQTLKPQQLMDGSLHALTTTLYYKHSLLLSELLTHNLTNQHIFFYIAVFAKMQFFKISVILHRIKTDEGDFWKVKKAGHNSQKTKKKIGQFFAPAVTFSLVVKKRLNFFEKSLLRWHLGCSTFQKMHLW